jgi:hypothetical protein
MREKVYQYPVVGQVFLKYIKLNAAKTPRIKKRFNTFPIPRYLRIIKNVRPKEKTPPRMELAKSMEKVKRRAKKTKTKKAGTAPKEIGSTK